MYIGKARTSGRAPECAPCGNGVPRQIQNQIVMFWYWREKNIDSALKYEYCNLRFRRGNAPPLRAHRQPRRGANPRHWHENAEALCTCYALRVGRTRTARAWEPPIQSWMSVGPPVRPSLKKDRYTIIGNYCFLFVLFCFSLPLKRIPFQNIPLLSKWLRIYM